jgi:3-hydroxybutyryl-CoA dehydrogenase
MAPLLSSKVIRRVAIIGAGSGGVISGARLALLCSRAGFSTVLEDVLPGNLRRAAAVIEADDPAFRPEFAGSIEDAVRDADLVIDTVPDELESKLEILSLLDRMAPPAALFATPTETLSIADLASCTYRPGQCFGLRFLTVSPAESLRVVVSYSPACEREAVMRMEAFLHALGAAVECTEDSRALP